MLNNFKKLLLIVGCCASVSSCLISSVDLESVTFKEDIVKDRKKSFDQLEMLSGLPGYKVWEVKGYRLARWKLKTAEV